MGLHVFQMSALLRENLSLQSKIVVFSRTLGGASGKKPACQSKKHNETQVQSPGSGRSPGGGHGNPLQYSCLGNPRDRGAWQAAVHRVAELDMK